MAYLAQWCATLTYEVEDGGYFAQIRVLRHNHVTGNETAGASLGDVGLYALMPASCVCMCVYVCAVSVVAF